MVNMMTVTSSNAFPIQYMRNRKMNDGDFMLLYGSLKEFSLLDLIQLFNFMKKSGELRIVEKDCHSKAVLLFDDSLLVSAFYEGKAGEEALSCIIEMTNGVFSFHNGTESFKKNLNLTTQSILMRIVQCLDKH
jgi:hypothetical protein